jgi:hypothetical protein
MLPSPSLGPPLLSASWSPPPFCGIPPPPLGDCIGELGAAEGAGAEVEGAGAEVLGAAEGAGVELLCDAEGAGAELLAGWLCEAEDAPPQAVTSAITAPNMIMRIRFDVIDVLHIQ